ncbi:DUF6286 domain-containing protein [Streptomyces chumphonensis]|uniref:DUF6286 domain-containing protein n=1 Tax=Streptomyces chumphonensis TaxID=1214925 RepID=UPI003D73D325
MTDESPGAPRTLDPPPADRDVTGPPGAAEGTAEREPGSARRGRFWSVRRLPSVLVALVLLFGIGFLLYDLIAVRAGREAAGWRTGLADELATRQLGDAWTIAGAAVVAALGLWLLLLALTPGLRSLLTMHGAPGLRAGLDRGTAAGVLREQAVQVPGVRSAKVRVRRRRARVRAVAHFREVEEVRTDLTGVLADTLADLGLARQPRLSVHVRRPDHH